MFSLLKHCFNYKKIIFLMMLLTSKLTNTLAKESPVTEELSADFNSVNLKTFDAMKYSAARSVQGEVCIPSIMPEMSDAGLFSLRSLNAGFSDVKISADGSPVLFGSTSPNFQPQGLMVVKLFPNMTIQWAKILQLLSPTAHALAINSDESIAVVGTTQSYNTVNTVNGFLASLNSNGTVRWAHAIGGNAWTALYDVDFLSDDSVAAIGSGGGRALLTVVNPHGNLQCLRFFRDSGDGIALEAYRDGSDRILLLTTASQACPSVTSGCLLFIQVSYNGTVESLNYFEGKKGMKQVQGKSLQLASDGSFIVSGLTQQSPVGVFLANFFPNATLRWAHGALGTSATGLALRPDGSALLTTVTTTTQALFAEFDSHGALNWHRFMMGSTNNNWALRFGAVTLDSHQNAILLGTVYSTFTVTSNTPVLARFDAHHHIPFLPSNFVLASTPLSYLPYFPAITPGSRSFMDMVYSVTPVNPMSYDAAQASLFNLNFRVNPWGDELNLPLNYAFKYSLFPNGPFSGIASSPTPSISIDLSTVSSWMQYDFLNQELYGTPLFLEPGPYTVQFSVSGAAQVGGSIYNVVQITFCVREHDARIPSYFRYPINPFQTANFNQTYALNFTDLLSSEVRVISVSGLDGNPLPSWFNYDENTQVLTGHPTGTIRGLYLLSVSFNSDLDLTLGIEVPNTAPLCATPPELRTTVGRTTVDLSELFRDSEGDLIPSYSLAALNGNLPPVFANIDSASRRLLINTYAGDQGQYWLNMTATDTYGAIGYAIISLNIMNQAPRLDYFFANPPGLVVGRFFSYSFPSNAFIDPDGDLEVFNAQGYPSFLAFDPNSRTLYGTPRASDRGNSTVTFIATDPYGLNGQANIEITVINSPPALTGSLLDQQTSQTVTSFSFTIPPFTDIDGDSMTYQAQLQTSRGEALGMPNWINFNANTLFFDVNPSLAAPGNYIVTITTTDSYSGLVGQAQFSLSVQPSPPSPQTTATERLQTWGPLTSVFLVLGIGGTLMARHRRITTVHERIKEWSELSSPRYARGDLAQVHAFRREVQIKLDEGASVLEIEAPFLQLENALKDYYAQEKKPILITQILSQNIIEPMMRNVQRGLFENSVYRNEKHIETLQAIRLLHSSFGLILAYHTGRDRALMKDIKTFYLNFIATLLFRFFPKTPEEKALQYELCCCKEALVCMSDTDTLLWLGLNAFMHLLSPTALFGDLKALAIDIPGKWYVSLLECTCLIGDASKNSEALSRIQTIATKEGDWRFRFGLAQVLLKIILNTQNEALLTQAIEGEPRKKVGYKHLLQSGQHGFFCHRNQRAVSEQAKRLIESHRGELPTPARAALSDFFKPLASQVTSRRSSKLTSSIENFTECRLDDVFVVQNPINEPMRRTTIVRLEVVQ